MVKTSDGVLDINPLERMERLQEITEEKKASISSKKKELEDLERKKRKEIEELDSRKKKDLEELEQKKRELEEMQKKKAQEIEETEELIEKSFQDLMRHKRQIIAEEDLEKIAASQKSSGTKENTNYTKFFENLEAPKRLYEVTNSNFYMNLTELRDKAKRGEITPEEEEFVQRLKDQFENFSQNPAYSEKDKNNYIQRSLKVIEDIDVSGYYR
jgi:hypothetical protein